MIAQIKAGSTVGDIGSIVQTYAEKQGLAVVRSLVGHGIGHEIHEDPRIPNYGDAGTGEVLPEHAVVCIEPMLTCGGAEVDFDAEDGWSVTTKDNSLCAHFEHMIHITKEGCEVLTKRN